MERLLIEETVDKVGKKVLVKGWVKSVRKHGKIVFFDVGDRSGILQVVCEGEGEVFKMASSLGSEDVVGVFGEIRKRGERFVNKKIKTGRVEMGAEKVEVFSKAEGAPFDIEKESLDINIDTLFDYRAFSLRHEKVKAIFKVQAEIAESFRKTLRGEGFKEFFGPTIVPSATEGGADVFHIDYYKYDAYLAQSPQLYKQIMVSIFERVFTIAHAYRAEPSMTTRHMAEYIGLDAEMGFIEDYKDITAMVSLVIKNVFKDVGENCSEELELYGASLPELSEEIPMVKLKEAQEIIFERTRRDNRKEPDLEPEDEREICKWAKEKHGSELVFISHYPTNKRPFYTYPDPEDGDYTLSFDLIGRGVEWATGGQRINDYQMLIANIKKFGLDVKDFEIYLQAFRYGMPAEGGFCLGLERVTQHILGVGNVKEGSLFPRDMERVDVRLSTIQKKKKDNG